MKLIDRYKSFDKDIYLANIKKLLFSKFEEISNCVYISTVP